MFYRLEHFGLYGQWIYGFAAGLCSFTAGQMITWPATALPMINDGRAGFWMSLEEQSWMPTIMYIVYCLISIPAGYIMDTIGRKNTLLFFDLIAVASWIVTYFGESSRMVFFGRALCGAWLGIMFTVVPVIIGEIFTLNHRGSMSIFSAMLYLGGFFVTLVGILVDYKTVSLISSITSILLFFNLLILPETPHFYLMKGKKTEAEKSIVWLRGSSNNNELDELEESIKIQLSNKETFLQLFTKKVNRKAFLITPSLVLARCFSGFAMLLTYGSTALPALNILSSEESFLILNIAWISSSGISFFILDKFGRRPLTFISSLGSCLAMSVVSAWYYYRNITPENLVSAEWLPLVGLVVHGLFYNMGLITIPFILQGEVFSVSIKGKASALTAINLAIVASLTVLIYQPLSYYVGEYINFLICAIASAMGVLISCTFMIETRGKSFEEIQDSLKL